RVEKPARNGGKFAFLTLSDPTGEVEIMVMPELLMEAREQLEPGLAVVIVAEVRRRDEEIRLSVRRVQPVEDARIGKKAAALSVHLQGGAQVEQLAAITERLRSVPDQDRGEIFVRLETRCGQFVTLKLPHQYATGLKALRALKTAPGVSRVEHISK
ncbi:MAG: OB-fold nucleic acid binding domain-containing protein, partial [Henriciella sp.]